MRIAYFITGLGLGGAEVVTINLANQMANRGYVVMIIYLNGNNEHTNIDSRINVIGLNMKKTPLGIINAIHKAKHLMLKFGPDVVHANMIHANVFVRLLRIFVTLPKVICSEHSMDIRGRGRMLTYRLTDFLSDMNTNVSNEATAHFVSVRAFGKSKSQAMYNGIDTKHFVRNENAGSSIRKQYGIEPDEFLFLHVGRLTQAKDHNTLISAFAQVENSKLLLVGKGELQKDIEQQIYKLGLDQRAIVAGAHPNTLDYYSAADCLVVSSAWEGLPTVVLEAMSCSLPIITTNVGAADETLGQKQWIVPIRNPKALTQAMKDMQATPHEQRTLIGAINCIKAQQFDLENTCNKWEVMYLTANTNKS